MENYNVYNQIAEKIPEMSKSHKKIASFILNNTNVVPFFNVATLAKKTDVSEATVVRFASFLGYSGYPELQSRMQSSIQKQLTTTERLKMTTDIYDDRDQSIYDIFYDDIENIKSTMEKLDIEKFHQAVGLLQEADKIYIAANRSAAALGIFLQYYLNIILGHAEMVRSVENLSEQLYNLNEKDVVIGISFPRYPNSTIQTLAFAKERGSKTICITDSLLSPMIPHSDVALTATSQMPTFIDSFTAPLSLINAIVVSIGKGRMEEVESRLEKIEEAWERFDVFHKRGSSE
ncbi:N-acetylmannosamine kinase [Siminovitchia terrae]|uniref:MurR/RpiR family transcriptional regulator n=1 Tax=Siminovitchia terrae TaxID=1914933 RepID=A0A429X1T5_SIMTE|nr:MurR/RpiR family transcriptional regulator [Siminovitchia terrae]RST57459.1 MurR/RpiR family transcriptional regulator [Siminovitchia terrae]GIN93541.1 N-acetylmannosamine kinase [Siminovitchia terrae]GIN95613.1 N-acetylmannosamine kinase [Siminovitchia terrae]